MAKEFSLNIEQNGQPNISTLPEAEQRHFYGMMLVQILKLRKQQLEQQQNKNEEE